MGNLSSSTPPVPAQFPQTLWSIVLAAGQDSSEKSQTALAALCQAYWFPLYAFLRRQGRSSHDAEDFTQAFFLHLLDGGRLRNVSPEKGKFRSFLLASLKNFVADEWAKSQTQRRGGGMVFVSLEQNDAERWYAAEMSKAPDSESAFERSWAVALLERVLQRLRAEFERLGKSERFEQLQVFLSGDAQDLTYLEVAKRLGMTEGAVKVAVLRMRQRYRELFRAEVAQTVADEKEIDSEIWHLLKVIAS